jgi:hypothetical protein
MCGYVTDIRNVTQNLHVPTNISGDITGLMLSVLKKVCVTIFSVWFQFY